MDNIDIPYAEARGIRCINTPDASTPAVADGRMYWTSVGIAFCASCADGSVIYKERLPRDDGGEKPDGETPIFASGVLASALAMHSVWIAVAEAALQTLAGGTERLRAELERRAVGPN